ncbi:MAG: hypothetical protein DMG54_08925 [Acidobacteria bacterium]|nr:MAG: hypothetical protein DMG54_08925 [Acidobacteriota bacterium]PYU47450.1 MAG: hypothetical protein DMG53_09005 [Acidobacteriota bacterium]PYU69482.1 MAG: hypothetical protein DMG52_28740 [Acidobacteriota bacterium]
MLLDTQHLQSITLSHFPGKPTIGGDWPETAIEEITGDVIEPDFRTVSPDSHRRVVRYQALSGLAKISFSKHSILR